jgi:hypothetical protein
VGGDLNFLWGSGNARFWTKPHGVPIEGYDFSNDAQGFFLFHRGVPFDTAAILLEGADKTKSPYHLEQSERQPFLEKCLQAIPFDAQSDGAQNSVIERIPAA